MNKIAETTVGEAKGVRPPEKGREAMACRRVVFGVNGVDGVEGVEEGEERGVGGATASKV